MGLKSRKKLAEALKEMGRLPADFDYRKLENEVYGKTACIYLFRVAEDINERRAIERELIQRGFKVNQQYDPNGRAIEVEVSYFKGWHWDE